MAAKSEAGVDFMAIGAHPDDIEILAGGTLLHLRTLGRSGVLVDMTDGGTGTRGTSDIRAREAERAARALNMKRVQLGLPDGQVHNTLEAQKKTPMPRGITMTPGQEVEGQLIFHYPITQKDWEGRKQFDVIIGFINQKNLVLHSMPESSR